jgi:hypothetical protein
MRYNLRTVQKQKVSYVERLEHALVKIIQQPGADRDQPAGVRMLLVLLKGLSCVFLAAVSPDCIQIARLYPEGPAEAHFRRSGVRDLYACCNHDGLFSVRLRDILSKGQGI